MKIVGYDGVYGTYDFEGLSTEELPHKADLPKVIDGREIKYMATGTNFFATDTFDYWEYNVETDKWSDGSTQK